MSDNRLLNTFRLSKLNFRDHYTAGSLISFRIPCIGYIMKGSAEFLYRGKVYTASAGDLIYIAADTAYYSVWSGSPEIEYYSVDFAFADMSLYYTYRFQILHHYDTPLFGQMYAVYETDYLAAVSLFYRLLSDIYKVMQTEDARPKTAVDKAILYLESHYNEPITVKELAERCYCSESRFFVLFRETTGVSPIAYKHNIAIQHALHLLSNTSLSIDEISEAIGFSSSNYFRTVFRKVTGKSPKKFRKG